MPPSNRQPGAGPNRPQGMQRRGRGRSQSRYGVQLAEKQVLKSIYGIRDEQLRRYYTRAQRIKEETGSSMIKLLERRLDNAIYRAGFAETRKQARQMASHRLFCVNGRVVNIPSYELKVGDKIEVKESKREKSYFTNFDKRMQNSQIPEWIELDIKNYGFKVIAEPAYEAAKVGADTQAVVEMLAR